jgi:IclR family transcriptional regulator, KDG regulon repressor
MATGAVAQEAPTRLHSVSLMKQSVHILKQTPGPRECDVAGKDNVSTTVLRALSLLDCLVDEASGLGLSAVARRAGLNKATAFRLLGSLQQAGLAVQDRASGTYRPGLKLLRMAEQVAQSLDLRAVAQPYVERLARSTGHTVLAGVLEGGEVVYVNHAQGAGQLRVHRQVGDRRSFHVSSIGKAILASLPAADAEAIVGAGQFERHTEHTILDPAAFLAHLVEVRRRGWALVREETIVGGSSVSAPVFDHHSRVVGAIGISAPSLALTGVALDRSVGLLLATCREASAELGHPRASEVGAGGAARGS